MPLIHPRLAARATALAAAVLLVLAGLGGSPASAAESLTLSMGWPPCVVGQPCTEVSAHTLQVQGGTEPYTFAVTSGQFPPGLVLSPSGDLSGVPTGGGQYTFTVTATDAEGATGSATGSFYAYGIYEPNIVLNPANPPEVSGIFALEPGQEGAAYSQDFTATGGTGPYTYAVGGGDLPDGLTLSPTGRLSGTPTTSGEWDFAIEATDSSTGTGPYTSSYWYELDVAPTDVTITTTDLESQKVGSDFYQQVEIAGGLAPYQFQVTSGALPAGLTLDDDGVISGIPTASGLVFFTVAVTDDTGGHASRQLSLTIYPQPLDLAPSWLPAATRGTPYDQTLSVDNGIAPYSFFTVPANLPPGLTLSTDGVLSGTPTATGSYSFSISAHDSATGTGPDFGVQTFTVTVSDASAGDPDTDGDGLSDATEISLGTDPDRADTDGDGLGDGAEVHGIWMRQRVQGRHHAAHPIGLVHPDPLLADSDHDGIGDGAEVTGSSLRQVVAARDHRSFVIGHRSSNPMRADTDGDGLRDRAEITGSANRRHRHHRSDPTRWDTDRGGVGDGREVRVGSDPADVMSGPRTPDRHS